MTSTPKPEQPHAHSAQTPDAAHFAIPKSIQRRLGLELKDVGQHVRAACGDRELDEAIAEDGVQLLWAMVDAYVDSILTGNTSTTYAVIDSDDGRLRSYISPTRTATYKWLGPGVTKVILTAKDAQGEIMHEGVILQLEKADGPCRLWMEEGRISETGSFIPTISRRK